MRIVFYSHYYPPEVNAPASRTSEHARLWVRAGHEVVVVTCAPNHPHGQVYPGYTNRLYQTETIEGVRVVRVWTFLAANAGHLARIVNYVSYVVSATLATMRLDQPDVIVSTSPQLFCGLTGLIARGMRRAPWVLEIRDLWPESIVTVRVMRKGFVVRLLERLEALAYRRADRIVCVTDAFVAHIEQRGGGGGKISVIKNGADFDRFTTPLDGHAQDIKRRLGLEGRFVASYVGTHGMAHCLDTILDAADRLRTNTRIVFLLVGDGVERERLEQRKQAMALDNVVMLRLQPKEAMPDIWQATDASLVLLRRDDLFTTVLPSKMFEAMAMRRPIILGVEGEARELLEEADAGIPITPESAESLARAVVRLADDSVLASKLGANGEAYVRAHHDRAKLAMRYLEVLDDVIASNKLPRRHATERAKAVAGE